MSTLLISYPIFVLNFYKWVFNLHPPLHMPSPFNLPQIQIRHEGLMVKQKLKCASIFEAIGIVVLHSFHSKS
jgi:hypothetical protein